MSGKRLALLIPDFAGGGAERVALRLVQDWVSDGHEVDLVLLRAEGELLALLPTSVCIVDLKAPRIRSAVRPLIAYLKTRQPDAIQASMWPVTILAIMARMLARSKTRIVVAEHSTLSRQYADVSWLRWLLLRNSLRFFYPRADVRVAVSERVARDLAELSGVNQEQIDVVYNPVPDLSPSADATQAERHWGRSHDRILTVGRLSAEKNHRLLIRAFAALKRFRPDAQLIIIGNGPLRSEIEQVVLNEGVEADVVMPGFKLDPWPYYATANLFVLTSNYEGFPLVLVEAMRSGLPIVSTDCESGPREILADGEYGALVPCNDVDALASAMEASLRFPIDAQRLKARAEELSGEKTSRRHLQLMIGGDQH